MILELYRIAYNEDSVIGALYIHDVFICHTLEKKSKLIPAGVHQVEVNQSPTFTKKRGTPTNLPLIYSDAIPASRGIRIHAGNSLKDTSGCVLVGQYVNDKNELVESRKCEDYLVYLMTENYLTHIVIHD